MAPCDLIDMLRQQSAYMRRLSIYCFPICSVWRSCDIRNASCKTQNRCILWIITRAKTRKSQSTHRYSPEVYCRAPMLIPCRSMLHPMRYPTTMVYHSDRPLACMPMTNDDDDDVPAYTVAYKYCCLVWCCALGCPLLSYSPNTFDTNDFYLENVKQFRRDAIINLSPEHLDINCMLISIMTNERNYEINFSSINRRINLRPATTHTQHSSTYSVSY